MSGPGGRGPAIGAPVAKPATFLPSARRLVARLGPEKVPVTAIVLLGTISVVLTVTAPRLLGDATNIIVTGVQDGTVDTAALAGLLGIVLVLYVVAAAFSYLQSFILAGVIQRTVRSLRSDVEDKLHRLPIRYFDSTSRGDLLSRVTNDVDNISQTLQQTLSQIITSLLTAIGVLVMMFALSPILALVSLVTIPLTALLTSQVAKRSQPLFAQQWASTGRLNGTIEESFTGHALIKVFNREAATEREFTTENDSLYTASFGAQFVSGIIQPATTFIGNLVYVVIAIVGAMLVIGGSFTIGGVQAFIQYSRQLTQPLSQLGSMVNLLQSGVASAERVFAVLDATEQPSDPDPAETIAEPRGRLAFEGVNFGYEVGKPLIRDLSFTAAPGSTIAIVGSTGAGKTTLVNLAMRFYEIDGGRITLDGVDTARMTRDDLRSRFGMVLQESWLFAGTIRENIAFGRLSAREDEIIEAAKATHVDQFVRTLPDGYDTMLDDDASSISVGQRQLITIARAFLSQPTVLILDEATSSVDTRTEVLVQKAMNTLRADRTSLVIAHRLSTIRDADAILVMASGSIVEQGSHDELLAADGEYATLYNAQFASS